VKKMMMDFGLPVSHNYLPCQTKRFMGVIWLLCALCDLLYIKGQPSTPAYCDKAEATFYIEERSLHRRKKLKKEGARSKKKQEARSKKQEERRKKKRKECLTERQTGSSLYGVQVFLVEVQKLAIRWH
jgi:hypothetical protein